MKNLDDFQITIDHDLVKRFTPLQIVHKGDKDSQKSIQKNFEVYLLKVVYVSYFHSAFFILFSLNSKNFLRRNLQGKESR